MRLVLASTSPWRGELLTRLGLSFEQRDPELDEAPYKHLGLPPRELVTRLAAAKAEALRATCPDSLVLGADQVVSIDGDILGKPGTVERAVEQLTRLAGRTHELITGTALLDVAAGRTWTRVDVHRMTMRALPAAALRDYVERDAPLYCAGSYKVESLGIALFERMEGDDWTSIVGLPLSGVVTLLAEAGVHVLAR